MESEERPAARIDPGKASIARVYDYGRGGKDHFAVDREVAKAGDKIIPNETVTAGVILQRDFVSRAVRRLATEGIRQFLDLGCGLPADENVHDVAQAVHPDARVAYVDLDPMVLTHGRALLANQGTIVVQADIRNPLEVLDHPEIRGHLDFGQPIGLLMFSVLHHLADQEDPDTVAAAFRNAACPGSYLALSHFHNPGERMPEVAAALVEYERVFNTALGTGRWRSHEEISGYFGEYELIEAGLVPVFEWEADGSTVQLGPVMYHSMVGGVARKP